MKFTNVDFNSGVILKGLGRFSDFLRTVNADVQATSRDVNLVVSQLVMQTETTFILTERRNLNNTSRHRTTLSHVAIPVQVVRLLLG